MGAAALAILVTHNFTALSRLSHGCGSKIGALVNGNMESNLRSGSDMAMFCMVGRNC